MGGAGKGVQMKYKKRFEASGVPKIEDFSGRYAVRLVMPVVPDIRFFGHFKFVPDLGAGERGWNSFWGGIRLGAFRMERGKSSLDGLEVVKIIYDDPSNPFFLKVLTDEVREERPGFYFCRGVFDVAGKPVIGMYFTMEKLKDS